MAAVCEARDVDDMLLRAGRGYFDIPRDRRERGRKKEKKKRREARQSEDKVMRSVWNRLAGNLGNTTPPARHSRAASSRAVAMAVLLAAWW